MPDRRVSSLVQRYYQSLLRMRQTSPGFFDMTLRQWLSTLGLALGLLVLGGALVSATSMDWAGWILCGMGLGALLRDIGVRRRSVVVWPLLDAVIDWDRVERLAESLTEPS